MTPGPLEIVLFLWIVGVPAVAIGVALYLAFTADEASEVEQYEAIDG